MIWLLWQVSPVLKEAAYNQFGLPLSNKPLVSFVDKFTEFKGTDVSLNAAAIYEKHISGVQTILVGHGGLWDDMHIL